MGRFLGVKFTPKTVKRIKRWVIDNNLESRIRPDKYHSSIIIDTKKKFPWSPKKYNPPLIVTPNSYKIEIFGTDRDAVVLTFDSKELESTYERARKTFGIVTTYNHYRPHVTLVYATDINLSNLTIPDFPLEISGEYVQPYNSGYRNSLKKS